mmetsp:Transcript_17180/g.31562  ORF Transcript_17180/g.31562 Transcript_17180/m.31562 type:complete len:573 (-) Transcript_17180:41-1759(-)|eukprot:CAMPEP_0184511324 /NCGR_PEP_ID=MMETSP0198_2-20121128/2288_1 /TAXON_ID=1112570 /ORGANISM="Thraustochytrium sp., Strain LLF1b" /LENGTH=572 /DNA_ID=CAMNT_0026901277 /DNA_START=30 /DNA_END=1748 /DNA_ORIENTATION=-
MSGTKAEEHAIGEFVELCLGIGSFGYGQGWDAKVQSFLDVVPLPRLLQLLEEASQRQDEGTADELCDVLKHVLASPAGSNEMSKSEFVPSLVQGLLKGATKVRLLAAHQIARISLNSFPDQQQELLIQSLVAALGDEETSVATSVVETLVSAAESSTNSRTLVLDHLAEMGQEGFPEIISPADPTVTQVRVFTVVARVCARYGEALPMAQDRNLLQPLMKAITSDDILVQLNVLKFIPLLATTSEGLKSMVKANVVDHLAELAGISNQGSGPADPFLGDEALRVMSQLSARLLVDGQESSANELADTFLQAMVERLQNASRSADVVTTVEMVGAFAGNHPPMSLELVMNRQNDLFLPWIETCASGGDKVVVGGLAAISAALQSGALKSAALPVQEYKSPDEDEFAALVAQGRPVTSPEACAEAARLGKQIFVAYGQALEKRTRILKRDRLGAEDVIELLMVLAGQPFEEQQCAAFALLRTVAAQDDEWGLRAIYGASQSTEAALFDRSLRLSKRAKEWRFGVAEAIYLNPHRDQVLGTARLATLKAFLQRGPYLGPKASASSPQVMVAESAS